MLLRKPVPMSHAVLQHASWPTEIYMTQWQMLPAPMGLFCTCDHAQSATTAAGVLLQQQQQQQRTAGVLLMECSTPSPLHNELWHLPSRGTFRADFDVQPRGCFWCHIHQ
jgi:hypothetical protein